MTRYIHIFTGTVRSPDKGDSSEGLPHDNQHHGEQKSVIII